MYLHPTVATMPLIPAWSIAPWVIVLLGVVVLHSWHARAEGGYARAWHLSHIAMGVGMIAMFLISHHDYPGVYWALTVVFALLVLAMAGGALLLRRATMGDRWIWGVTTLDQLAMVYMLVPLAQRPAGVTSVFVGYLVLAALAWLVNPLAVVDAIRSRPGPVLEVRAAVATAAARQPAPLPVDAVDRTEDALPASDSHPDSTGDSPSVPMRIAADLTLGVRITLAIMAVAMAWMLLAMQQMDSSDMHHNHHADMSPSLSWSR